MSSNVRADVNPRLLYLHVSVFLMAVEHILRLQEVDDRQLRLSPFASRTLNASHKMVHALRSKAASLLLRFEIEDSKNRFTISPREPIDPQA